MNINKALFLAIFLCNQCLAQDSSLNILRAPSSPAANMLGISPSDIQRPTDPSAFMVSLQNATNSFSALPNSYAVDIAPAWLLMGQMITYNQFISNANISKNIWQSLVISAATTDSSGISTKLGFGLKFSILRGEVNQKVLDAIDSSEKVLSKMNAAITQEINEEIKSEEYKSADAQASVMSS